MLTCTCSLKKGIRGEVSDISKRYSKANNKYLKSHEPEQITCMIMLCLSFF